MADAPDEVWRALAYDNRQKRAVIKFFSSQKRAEENHAQGTEIVRYVRASGCNQSAGDCPTCGQ